MGIIRILFRAVTRKPAKRKWKDLPAPPVRQAPKKIYRKKATNHRTQAIVSTTIFQEAKVEKILDGDTIIVSTFSQKKKIRLDSIDCPENDQPCGDTAKFGLIKMIGGRMVHLEEHGTDQHERTLATIYVKRENDSEWVNVNERMVTLGHAWVMRAYYSHLPKDRRDKLNSLERWAKSKKVGLWRTSNPIPPWKWRHGD